MEFVSGVPITEHCDRHKLTIEERLELFLQVCDAVQHAHQKGIIHRDIKPSNILVSLRNDRAVAKIIDFGIAKALSQPLTERTLYTEQGRFVGTPEYMSPEQAEMTAQGVDTRTDVYSLGVVLYELLAGVLPFDSDTLREGGAEHIRWVIREEDPKTPSTRLRSISGETSTKLARQRRTDVRALGRRLRGDLDWITVKAMAKEPNRRYATAHALAEDIQRHLHHEPVTARSPTLVYRLGKFARRNRTQVMVGMSIVVLVLMGFASVKLYRQNAANTRKLAEELRSKAHRLVPSSAAADYSPDGRKLVYARLEVGTVWHHETPLARPEKPGAKGIHVIEDFEHATIRSLVSFGFFPRWSPDGQYIAFVKSPYSFRSAFEQIYVIPAAGGEPWHLGKGVLLGWSRDSKYIYYHRYMEDWFVYRKAFDDPRAEPERVTYSPSYLPAISPDEKYVAYEHRGEILITEIETCETVAAGMLDQLARFQATCSQAEFRDGTRVVDNATRACELSHGDSYRYIDTLAAAYAEAGQFEQAARCQRRAMTKLSAETRPGRRADCEARLRLYQAGQSYHGQYLHAGKLIARYTFDEVGGNTVRDSSGNRIDGTLVGDARIVNDPVRGKVLELDGDGDWVDCGNDQLFDVAEEITLSSWIKVAGPPGWRAVIAKGSSWRLQGWENTVKFVCGVKVPGDIGVASGVLARTNLNDGRWHHIAGVYDGRTATLYIDGRRDVSAAAAGPIAANNLSLWIGWDSHRTEGAWNGRIDDVRIYSCALGEDKIGQLYSGSQPSP